MSDKSSSDSVAEKIQDLDDETLNITPVEPSEETLEQAGQISPEELKQKVEEIVESSEITGSDQSNTWADGTESTGDDSDVSEN